MDPTPRRDVELEDVLLTNHEERVIRDRHDAGDDPPDTTHHHHDPGKRRPTNRPTTRIVIHPALSHLMSRPHGPYLPHSWPTTSTTPSTRPGFHPPTSVVFSNRPTRHADRLRHRILGARHVRRASSTSTYAPCRQTAIQIRHSARSHGRRRRWRDQALEARYRRPTSEWSRGVNEWVYETACTALESAELPPDAGRIGLVGEVSEDRHRDDGDTPQRSYNEPHEILHHRRVFLAGSGYGRAGSCWPLAMGPKAPNTRICRARTSWSDARSPSWRKSEAVGVDTLE